MKIEDLKWDNADTTTMPDGTVMRKGSIFTAIQNALIFDSIAQKRDSSQGIDQEIKSIVAGIREVILTLAAAGIFTLFPPVSWILGGSEGRALVAAIYMTVDKSEYGPVEKEALAERIQGGSQLFKDVISSLDL